MRIYARLAAALRGWLRPGALDSELSEELHDHLDRQVQANIDAGMTRDEAYRAAALVLGNIESIRDESRAARPGAAFHQTARDVAFGVRLLRRSPALAAAALIVVALGIGAVTAIVSVVYGVLLRPLPYAQPDRVVAVWTRLPDSLRRVRSNPADHREWLVTNTVFEDIALANAPQNFNFSGGGEPERLLAARLSSNVLSVLGITPALGRGFLPAEERTGDDRVVLLSDGLWRRRFGADPSIVGRTIILSGLPYAVIGVMRPEFRFPEREHQLWIPLAINPRLLTRQTSGYDHLAVARLKPTASIAQAQREMNAIAVRLAQQYPATNRGVRFEVLPLNEESVRDVRPALYLLLAAAFCLLLIACLNLAGLLATRAATRTREFGVRQALGASRRRLLLQALAEVIPVLAVGGVSGIAIAEFAVSAFLPIAPPSLPRVDSIQINTPVLAFSILVLVITGVVASLVPAVHAWRVEIPTLTRGTRTGTASRDQSRMRNALVVAQLALTLPMLVAAMSLSRSFTALMTVDPGFRTQDVLSLQMAIPRSKYRDDAQIATLYSRIIERVEAIPGVSSAGMVNRLPLSGNNQVLTFAFEGISGPPITLQSRSVTPDYFETMSIPLRDGRLFAERDRADAPLVGLIDERTARMFWPGERAVGKRFRVALPAQASAWGEIVGVVGFIRHDGLDGDGDRQLYLNYRQFTDGRTALVVRARDDPWAVTPAVLQAIHTIDPEQPVYDVRSMDDVRDRSTAQRWLDTAVVTVFALGSLLLSSVGLYGVIAFGVTQRTREFGVRQTLGAARGDISRLVLRAGSRLVMYGTALGLAAALAFARSLKTVLFAVDALDPIGFVAACGVLCAVALAATYLPARRAARTDPANALRAE